MLAALRPGSEETHTVSIADERASANADAPWYGIVGVSIGCGRPRAEGYGS